RRGLSCGWKPCDSYRFQPNANIGVRAYRRICRAPFGWLFEKLLSDGLTIGSARPPALLNLNPKVLAMPRACNKQNSDRVPGCCYLTDGLGSISCGCAHYPRLCHASLRGIPPGLLEDSSSPDPHFGTSLQPGTSRVRVEWV